jgi:hypothetical protein
MRESTSQWANRDLLGRLSGGFSKHKLEKIVASGQGKKYPSRQCRICAAHRKHSEMIH